MTPKVADLSFGFGCRGSISETNSCTVVVVIVVVIVAAFMSVAVRVDEFCVSFSLSSGEFHDQADADWIVIRGQLRGHNDTPIGQPTGRICCF
jgi:hypothetical protein